jgi:membrane protein
VLLIWLYISSNIIILGGEINATLAYNRDGRFKPEGKQFGPPTPWFKRLLVSAKQGGKDATSDKPDAPDDKGLGGQSNYS